jgi:hypothetical protein
MNDLEIQDDNLNEENDFLFKNQNQKIKTNFFNSKILQCINNHKEYINNYLKNSFNRYLDDKLISANFDHNFLEFEITNNKISIFGKQEKSYYIKNDNEIFIEFLIELPSGENYAFGIKIFKNGKFFAGKFDEIGALEGNGIYISKKGDLYAGNFVQNELNEAIIYCSNGTCYEGTLLNLKKHGINQTEISENYEFFGDFENGKKVQGIFYPKNEHFNLDENNNCNNNQNQNPVRIKSIEINKENLLKLKKSKKIKKLNELINPEIFIENPNYNNNPNNNRNKNINNNNNQNYNSNSNEDDEHFMAKIIFEYEGQILIYYGNIKKNKLNDLNAILQFDLEKKFPIFNASIKDNIKDGKCTFYNSEDDFYGGVYINGIFFSDIEKNRETEI